MDAVAPDVLAAASNDKLRSTLEMMKFVPRVHVYIAHTSKKVVVALASRSNWVPLSGLTIQGARAPPLKRLK